MWRSVEEERDSILTIVDPTVESLTLVIMLKASWLPFCHLSRSWTSDNLASVFPLRK